MRFVFKDRTCEMNLKEIECNDLENIIVLLHILYESVFNINLELQEEIDLIDD